MHIKNYFALKLAASLLSLALFAPAVWGSTEGKPKIDFDSPNGVINAVNGVGQPPVMYFGNTRLFHYLKEAGIPYSRLHDVGGAYGGFIYVDIPNVFRDFDADENDPASYDFAFTDLVLKGLVENGVEPYYRLGVTIENKSVIKAYRIFPPKDYAKWARIAEHIIMHYNYGWADGFRMNISHWEIWNEPDNNPSPDKNPCWRGDWQSYMDFYGTVAPYLKEKFPGLKIGGYGSCGFYAITDDGVKFANNSGRNDYFMSCFHAFLKNAKEKGWPLDFFSAHSYSEVPKAIRQMEYARKTLDEYGYTATELSVNEWLPNPELEKLGTALQAAEIAAEMIGFQHIGAADAEIYDAKVFGSRMTPLFDSSTLKPRRGYYSFVMFKTLRDLGGSVPVPDAGEGVYLCSATDGNGNAAILISNISGKTWKNNLDFGAYKQTEVRLLDETHNNEVVGKRLKALGTSSVALVLLQKSSSK